MGKKFLSLFLAFALLIGQAPAVLAADSEGSGEASVMVQEDSGDSSAIAQEGSGESLDAVQEEDGDPETIPETPGEDADENRFTTVSYSLAPDPGLPGNEELFAAYAESVLYGTPASAFGIAAGARLSAKWRA